MKKTILAAFIAILLAIAVGQTQDLFSELTTNVVAVKYRYRIFQRHGIASNTFIEYIYNSKSKNCLARITDVADPNLFANGSTLDKVYYIDVNSANCK